MRTSRLSQGATVNSITLPGSSDTSPYSIDDDGLLYIHGSPTQADFELAWDYVLHVQSILPRIIGNMLAHAERQWGSMYTDELIERSGRKYSTLAQYHSTYSRLPPEHQRPGILYSYEREVARLPIDKQPAVLDRVEAGEFSNSDELALEVRRLRHEPARYVEQPRPMPCPICGGNGWSRAALHRVECPHAECGAHGDEILERFAALLDAVREYYTTGDRGPLDVFVQAYKHGWEDK